MVQELCRLLRDCPKISNVSEISFEKDTVATYGVEDKEDAKRFVYLKIAYRSQGHLVIGYLIVPRNNQPMPCIIYNRAGSGENGLIQEAELYSHKYSKFAEWGYVTIMTQYSGNGGSEGKDEFGGSEIQDVVALKEILQVLPFCDVARIGMYGSSRGGTMTYLALREVPWIKAAVIKAGMADKFRGLALRPEMRERSALFFDVDDEREMIRRSAVRWPEKLAKHTAILLIHGTADAAVSVEDAKTMDRLLSDQGIIHELLLIEGGDHRLKDHKEQIDEASREWFRRYLG